MNRQNAEKAKIHRNKCLTKKQKRYLYKLKGKKRDRFLGKLKNHGYSWGCKCLFCTNQIRDLFKKSIDIQEYKEEKREPVNNNGGFRKDQYRIPDLYHEKYGLEYD